MHITLIPIGTRGDVQPHVALGRELCRAGHQVRIATHACFARFVTSLDLQFFDAGGDPDGILAKLGPAMSDPNPLKAIPAVTKVLSTLIIDSIRGVSAACRDTDLIVSSYPALYSALDVAQQNGVPLCLASLHPLTPTAFATNLMLPPLPSLVPQRLRGMYNRASHGLADELIFNLVCGAVNAARAQQVRLRPLTRSPVRIVHERRIPILYPLSETLMPMQPDWPDFVHVTGFWFLKSDSTWQPPPSLLDFLAVGPPPLYVGFGSTDRTSDLVLRTMIDALIRRGQRALIFAPNDQPLSGLSAMAAHSPNHLFRIGPTPHDWLLPRTCGVIHHGGAGTTAAALQAGVPMGVVAFSVEQRYWGTLAHGLNVAPPSETARALTASRADTLIRQVVADASRREAAKKIGALVRAEHGVARATTILENLFPSR